MGDLPLRPRRSVIFSISKLGFGCGRANLHNRLNLGQKFDLRSHANTGLPFRAELGESIGLDGSDFGVRSGQDCGVTYNQSNGLTL